jgi:hypothetical protein
MDSIVSTAILSLARAVKGIKLIKKNNKANGGFRIKIQKSYRILLSY